MDMGNANELVDFEDLEVTIRKSKVLYQKEDGNFIVLEVESISQHVNESGQMLEVIILKEKGKNE